MARRKDAGSREAPRQNNEPEESMPAETFTVLQGIGMVIAEIGGIVLAGLIATAFRNHFSWIKRIAP